MFYGNRYTYDDYYAAVLEFGANLALVPKRLIDSKICAAAVARDGWALECVPVELRDREICLAAVRSCPVALKNVPESLRDMEMCEIAVRGNDGVLKYVPDSIRHGARTVDELRIRMEYEKAKAAADAVNAVSIS